MYLALERPWASGEAVAEVPPDAGPAVAEPAAKGKKKRARRKKSGGPTEQRFEPDPEIVLTPGDLAMTWRGDKVERPPAQLDMASGGEARSLDQGEINATIASDGGGLQDCVVEAVGAAPYSGEVTVKMLVDGDGDVTKLRVHAPAFMHAENLLGCARGAARRMRYPAVGGYTVVTIPFPISAR